MNKLVKTVNKKDLNYEYLRSLNGILELTNRELELLSKFVEFDVELGNIQNKNVACSSNRKKIKQELGITPDNLSRYITKFKEKGLLLTGKADDELTVNKILIPEIVKDRVQLTIITVSYTHLTLPTIA